MQMIASYDARKSHSSVLFPGQFRSKLLTCRPNFFVIRRSVRQSATEVIKNAAIAQGCRRAGRWQAQEGARPGLARSALLLAR